MHSNGGNSRQDDSALAVRSGQGLLTGLLRCGRCGRKLHIRYWGKSGTAARYVCVGDFATGGQYCLGFGGATVRRLPGLVNSNIHHSEELRPSSKADSVMRRTLSFASHTGSRSAPIHWGQDVFDQSALVREFTKWGQGVARVSEHRCAGRPGARHRHE
jgi:hypothetical protein